MARALIFFFAFLGAIVVPQLVMHVLNYRYPRQPRIEEDEEALRGTFTGFDDPALVFGPRVPHDLVQEGRAVYPEVLRSAEVAQLGVTGTGPSVLAARFSDAKAATRARYALFTMLGKVKTEQDDNGFYHFTWPQSGHAAIAGSVGRTFMLWVAQDRSDVERLHAESRAFRMLTPVTRTGLGRFVDNVRDWPVARSAAIVAVYTLLVSWFFLRLVPWATEVEPQTVADRASAALLRERLLAVRFLDSPISIVPGHADDELVVDWKYADAKWVDHARAHGMRASHRLILELDESTRTVRGREFQTESGWDAGLGGASIRWKASWEIVFYQYEHQRVFGLQVGPDGRLQPALEYSYTFNLQEMKDPVIAAVTAAGWRWRQVFFFSPSWLSWLHG
jgi:hypothetical protein